jgi:DNA (cytosine-5)-methyltransferase 1
MCSLGYYDEWKELNSADYGAYTSRNRLFGCFAKHGLPIIWPAATHSKKAAFDMFGGMKKWMPVKEVLDFADEGESIFNRKKPLSDKTLERIYAGLIKYVAKGDTSFISKYYSGRSAGKVIPTDGPAGTITTADGQALVNTKFILKYNSTDKNGKHTPPSVEEPLPVITAQSRLGLIQGQFLASYYGNGHNLTSIESPAPTIPTKDRVAIVNPEYFIDKHFGTAQNQSIDQPAGSILPTDKHRLVQCDSFIMPTNFDNKPTSLENPLPTITANRKHHYIVNPSHGGHSTSTEAPCPVIIARQDKAPLYLVQVENGPVAIAVFDCDTEIMIKIKQFMCVFGLVDIKMRMLRVHELLRIQGFPADYQMVGNQSDHKKFIGNSVHPLVPKMWAEAMGTKLIEEQTKAA